MLLSFSNNFNNKLFAATINDESETPGDRLIGGLLTANFDEGSCLSRSYEMRHKRCGPGTKAYKEATKHLSHDENYNASKSDGECRYVVWLADYGLGNRLLTLASVFLYALLTDRIILVDNRKDIGDLLCEPFPGTSWLLPLDFPLMKYADGYHKGYSRCYGTIPLKETVFHHLDERLGIQIRVFRDQGGYYQHVMDQVISCTQREKLLPELATQEESKVNISNIPKSKAVLVTSLSPEYSKKLENMFSERANMTGEIIKVYQPSGERYQQTDKKVHDQKALAEMYLLSLTDNIVASSRSTFGYVAYSLGGLKPWLLYLPNDNKAPDPPCVRSTSMEPCFLTPPTHGCEPDAWGTESGKVVPFVRYCEDIWGLKLFDEL
ncbi:unnamed protein product [Arabidopsis thaliana]|uniref:Fucosyltransferase n=1 Tax=Arabidopsis thaliana TaxID=3702 RepID=A0A7G2E6I4_ARATH|nr:unnamed protein product [Arabidopsis thaliana]